MAGGERKKTKVHHTQLKLSPKGSDGFAFSNSPSIESNLKERLLAAAQDPIVKPEGSRKLFPWAAWFIKFKVADSSDTKLWSLTAKAKISDLQKFLLYFYHFHKDGDLGEWSPSFTISFIERMEHDHYSAVYIHRIFSTISPFAKYLQAAGLYKDEDFPIPKDAKLPVRPTIVPRVLKSVKKDKRREIEVAKSEEVYEMMMEAAKKRIGNCGERHRPLRDIAILATLWGCALRVSEVCSIKGGQLDYDEEIGRGFLIKIKCKGKKEREVDVPDEAYNAIQAYFAEERGNDKDSPLFQSWHGRALTRFGVYEILEEIAGLCPVPADVHIFFNPHRFRHDRATTLLNGGMKESELADYLGHSSTQYIGVYTKPDRKDRVRMIREAEEKSRTQKKENW